MLLSGKEKWLDRVRREGKVELLLGSARNRFGAKPVAQLAALLSTVKAPDPIDEIGRLIVACETNEALLALLGQMALQHAVVCRGLEESLPIKTGI